VLVRLATVLGVTTDELLCVEPTPVPAASTAADRAAHNRALVEDLVTEVVNHGNFAVAEQVLAPTYTVHGPFPELQLGRAVVLRALRRLRRAFPDISVTLDELVATEARVVVRWTLTGTHTGAVGGRVPQGTLLRYSGMAVFGITAGRIAEGWMTGDTHERALLWDLGLLPAPKP
jgi:steroid delta-isomerase-like uncharacterized protein